MYEYFFAAQCGIGDHKMFLKFLFRLLPGPYYKVPGEQSERRDARVKEIVKRNAEGNVRLGQGKVLTRRQRDMAYKNVQLADF